MRKQSSAPPCHLPSPRLSAAAFAAVLLLGGCVTMGPFADQNAALAIPPTWSETLQTPAAVAPTPEQLAQWWRRFNDPLLSGLVDEALAANTDVLGAQAALRQARAQRDVTAAGLQPTLDISGSGQRSRPPGGSASNQFQTGFDASWEPDIFGQTRYGVTAADEDIAVSSASLGDVRVSVAAEVALAYVDLRGNQLRLEIARQNLANQEEVLQLTRWREQAGLVTSLDVEQARTSVEQTRARIPPLQAAIVKAMNSLAILTGMPPGSLHDQLALASAPAIPQPEGSLALSLPAETLRQRPDVRSAEHGVNAAVARLAQAQAARYPSFRIGGSLGLSALTIGSLGDSGTVTSSLLGSITAPLFDGGSRRAQIRVQDAALEKARAAYTAALLNALGDVENALVSLRTTREYLGDLNNAVEAAGNAALLAEHNYSSGLVDFQVVLTTQQTRLNVEDSAASAAAELAANHIQLYKALGGGWHPDGAADTTENESPAGISATSDKTSTRS